MPQVIIFTNQNGGVSVCVPTGELPIEVVQRKDIPSGTQGYIIDASELPEADNDFFDAWEQVNGVVTVNINKAKTICHDIRRAKRAAEFTPLDIKATIPSEAAAAEAARQAIREKYAAIQVDIDAAADVAQLKRIADSLA